MVVRRVASTETIHPLWDAICYMRQQKQIPNIERINNYMKRKHKVEGEPLSERLELAVQDGLVEVKKVVGFKGARVGVEQDSFRMPENKLEKDGHDWYCFTCHKEGDVVLCSTCHRVYHEDCLKEPYSTMEELVCEVCEMNKNAVALPMEVDDFNLLLNYCSARLKEKIYNCPEVYKMAALEDERWRHDLIIYHTMDLAIIEDKTVENVYLKLEEFQTDVMTLVHNIVIYYGVHSTMADMARLLLRDCCYDVGEIRQCRDCYRMSNEKRNKLWFCQPCNPPHELVYAKQKGYPFWPAKVIRIDDGVYDVRFFGGYHQRANIEKEHIRPISTPVAQLQLKQRTVALNKALEELKRHQQLLGQIPWEKRPSPLKGGTRPHKGARGRKRKRLDFEEDPRGSPSQDERPTSSSPKVPRFKHDAPTPEDHNVVSSSCQESTPCLKVSVSTQTHKKLLASLLPPVEEKPCKCEEKYEAKFKDFKEHLQAEHKAERDRSLGDLAARLREDFEEEKERAVGVAVEQSRAEAAESRRAAEEQLRAQHKAHATELIETHRSEVSEIKKKQWCYNCEAEAIYHCCWNTSYCSVDCQQVHWHKEHKRTCRRKR